MALSSVTTKEIVYYPSDLNTSLEECKVVTPYLALEEFLRDLNPISNYCDVSLSVNVSHTTIGESINKLYKSWFPNDRETKTNATLSLLYKEEQSKSLPDPCYNLEKRQVKKSECLWASLTRSCTRKGYI